MDGIFKDIEFEKLIPFKDMQKQEYEGDWTLQLEDCIRKAGLMEPVIVRPAGDKKYEIICGHSRIKALEMLGCKVVHADIRNGLSDEEAAELYRNSSFARQPFSACSYSKRFEIIKHYEEIMKKDSCQGKRTDLERKASGNTGKTCVQLVSDLSKACETYVQLMSNSPKTDETRVQLVSNLSEKSRHPTLRDKEARCLGISTATLSKYRRIIKLPDNMLTSIAWLLDEKRMTLEAAYIISSLKHSDIGYLIKCMENYPEAKIDMKSLKEFSAGTLDIMDILILSKKRKIVKVIK